VATEHYFGIACSFDGDKVPHTVDMGLLEAQFINASFLEHIRQRSL
jgi:hypothetical protein